VIKSRCPCCAPSWLRSQNGRVAVAQAKRTLGKSHISTCVLAPPSLNTPSVGRCSSQLSRSSALACILDSTVAANVSTAPQARLAGSEFSSRTCEKCAATTLRLLRHGTGAQKTATPTNYCQCTLARWHSRRRHDLPLIQHRERVGPSLAVLTAAQVSCSPEMTVRPLPKLSRWLAEPCSLAHDAISVGPPKIQKRTNGVSRAGVSGAPGPNCGNIPIPITTVVLRINQWRNGNGSSMFSSRRSSPKQNGIHRGVPYLYVSPKTFQEVIVFPLPTYYRSIPAILRRPTYTLQELHT